MSISASTRSRCSSVNGSLLDHASALALVRKVSEATPSFSLSPRVMNFPVITPMDPVMVPGLARIASAPMAT
ncbi:Uncharacterised protein [Mycobacteroides abscessus subsp. massiliense]|nr:Uncharacterised protein [Mycobacteroides abscessus subsp. massiliense]